MKINIKPSSIFSTQTLADPAGIYAEPTYTEVVKVGFVFVGTSATKDTYAAA